MAQIAREEVTRHDFHEDRYHVRGSWRLGSRERWFMTFGCTFLASIFRTSHASSISMGVGGDRGEFLLYITIAPPQMVRGRMARGSSCSKGHILHLTISVHQGD